MEVWKVKVKVEGYNHTWSNNETRRDRKIIVYYMFYQKLDMHTFLLF